MTISLATFLFLALGLAHPVHMSFPTLPDGSGSDQDFDGSGSDFNSSGSGSGDWPEQDEITDNVDQPGNKDQMFDSTLWPLKDNGYIILANSKTSLETKEAIAGVIAGGVTGGVLAVILSAIVIYKWHNKDFGGYILGRQAHTEQVI